MVPRLASRGKGIIRFMKITPAEIGKILPILEATISRIASMAENREAKELNTPASRGKWSAVEVLAHLRACDDIWRHSIYAMLVQEHPSLPDLDERRWAKVAGYAQLDFHQSFLAFRIGREELILVLRKLPLEAWSRDAEIFGRTHTVFSQARRLALHEAEHCKQIEAILNGEPQKEES